MSYAAVKHAHAGAAAASLVLFAVRGAWMLWSPAQLERTWVRVVPHVVDTVLLASALWLAVALGAFPGWLAAKVVALLGYVALGTIALKRGRTRAQRTIALVAALATFAYIVSVAITKSPLGLFARL
jgi:uncharacterized membrane protein SirB2